MSTTIKTPEDVTAALVEHQLAGHCEATMRRGFILVYDAFEVTGKHGHVIGVCALGAYNAMAARGERLSLPDPETDGDAFVAAWDAIEAGWDESDTADNNGEWYMVGLRLRFRFRPVPASSMGGA